MAYSVRCHSVHTGYFEYISQTIPDTEAIQAYLYDIYSKYPLFLRCTLHALVTYVDKATWQVVYEG